MSFDTPPSACPPVVEYGRAEQARVAEEIAKLTEGALIPGWLADYAVVREQARACSRGNARWLQAVSTSLWENLGNPKIPGTER